MTRAAVALAVVVGSVLAAGRAAQAQQPQQPGVTVRPSVGVGVVFDDNISATPDNRQRDTVLRVTPATGLDVRRPHGTFEAEGSFDAERYQEHPGFTTPIARYSASTQFKAEPTSALTFTGSGSFTHAETPLDLLLTTGFALPRGHTRQLLFQGGATIQTAPSVGVEIHYLGGGDRLSQTLLGSPWTWEDEGRLLVGYQIEAHERLVAGYIVRRFAFDTAPSAVSQVAVGGWTHKFSAETSFSVLGGPRFDALRRIRLELEAAITHRPPSGGETSLTYARTQTALVGELVPIDVERLTGLVSLGSIRSVNASLRGGFYQDAIGVNRARVYQTGADLTAPLGGALFFSLSYGFDYQTGAIEPLFGLFSTRPVRRNVVAIRFVVTPGPWPRQPKSDSSSR